MPVTRKNLPLMEATTAPVPVIPSPAQFFVRKALILSFHRRCFTLAFTMLVFLNLHQFLNVSTVRLLLEDFLFYLFRATGDNIEVIPTSQHEKYTLIENIFGGHSYSGIDTVPMGPIFGPTHETVCCYNLFCE